MYFQKIAKKLTVALAAFSLLPCASISKPKGEAFRTVEPGTIEDTSNPKLKEILTLDAKLNHKDDEFVVYYVRPDGNYADWALWMDALAKADVLSKGVRTVAYSYIGPELSHAIYRDGTIGAAKKDLEATALKLNEKLSSTLGGAAYVSENKGLVTRSSAVIPIISLYLSIMFKVMKEKGTHEGCIEQMERLFAERLYTGENSAAGIPETDSEHRIRIDDWEMADDVQAEVVKRMEAATEENLSQIADMEGYKHDFLTINGFDVEGVDYNADVAKMNVID